jgi:uridine kinase
MAQVIGVAGGSGSGKSTIVRALVSRLGGTVIDTDAYYHDRSGLVPAQRSRLNYDEPAAFDAALLVSQITSLARGESVAKPLYSFETHTRVGVEVIAPSGLVIVEGLFTLWWERLRSLLDVKVFVDAPSDVRLTRRIRRDIAERGRTVDQVLQQYLATVRPMHERYVEPTRAFADLVIVNDGELEPGVRALCQAVGAMAKVTV